MWLSLHDDARSLLGGISVAQCNTISSGMLWLHIGDHSVLSLGRLRGHSIDGSDTSNGRVSDGSDSEEVLFDLSVNLFMGGLGKHFCLKEINYKYWI